MWVIFVALYVLACALVASLGRRRILGFWTYFLLSLVFSPFLILILLFVTLPVQGRAAKE